MTVHTARLALGAIGFTVALVEALSSAGHKPPPAAPRIEHQQQVKQAEVKKPDEARGAFSTATDLLPQQANAHDGLALAGEMRQDSQPALGDVRSQLHLSPAEDPWRTHARAATRERETRRGRH